MRFERIVLPKFLFVVLDVIRFFPRSLFFNVEQGSAYLGSLFSEKHFRFCSPENQGAAVGMPWSREVQKDPSFLESPTQKPKLIGEEGQVNIKSMQIPSSNKARYF